MTSLDFTAECKKCGEHRGGRLLFDSRTLTVVDSDGGLLFADGWRCHVCLGEPYLSSDHHVTLDDVERRTAKAERLVDLIVESIDTKERA